MSIVCGTDFSRGADVALRVAIRLAKKRGDALVLVHALQPWAPYPTPLGPEVVQADGLRQQIAEKRLGELAASVREAGVEVHARTEVGVPRHVLAEAAAVDGVQMVVVGRGGDAEGPRWHVGSLAARLIDEAAVPVLAVREGDETLVDWLDGRRTLVALVAINEDTSSEAPIAWAKQLAALGKCELHFIHWYWPPAVYERFGLGWGADWHAGDVEAAALLERNLRERIGETPYFGLSARPVWGAIGEAVSAAAADLRADLVITGTHQRHALGRFVHGSVSHDVFTRAPASTVVVPARAAQAEPERVHVPRRVLAPTDLSPRGNHAVAQAYALVRDGGVVDLLHVVVSPRVKPSFGEQPHTLTPELDAKLRSELQALVPAEAGGKGTVTRVHVVEAPEVAAAITQTAERSSSDLVCMASHGRSGIAHALVGSVAEQVLRRVHCPVVMVRTVRS